MSVKFACDRCGKRFASVDDPRPGRVYRIRCRCGNVVVLRPPAAATRVDAAAPAPRRQTRGAERHAPPSRPRPPPIPARGAAPVAASAAAARTETPLEVLEPIGELTPPAAGGEREPTFEPLPAPEPATAEARAEPTPTSEPVLAPPQAPPEGVEATAQADAPPAAAAPRVDATPTIEPVVAPAPPPLAVEPAPPEPPPPEPAVAAPAAAEPTPPILDDPFARAAAEEAAGADEGTPGIAEGLPLAPAPDDAGETPVELSRSESLALPGLGNLFRGVVDAPAEGGSGRRWIAVAAGLLVAAAIAVMFALR